LLLVSQAHLAWAGGALFSDWQQIHPELAIETTSEPQQLVIPSALISYRIAHSAADPRIEAVTLKVPRDPEKVAHYATSIAVPGKAQELAAALGQQQRILPQKLQKEGEPLLVKVDEALAPLVDPAVLTAPGGMSTHQHLAIKSAFLRENTAIKDGLLAELALFLSAHQRRELVDELRRKERIEVEQLLLPPFARRVVGKFSVYQGLNCFHAALSFQNPDYTRSPFYNINQEKDHHRLMINSDELWRVLKRDFYPLPSLTTPVKFGDILLYFELASASPKGPGVNEIRHASVYLLDNYTFSKGSKSSYTPYVIKLLADEWKFWAAKTKNLGIKIFRRYGNYVTKLPSPDRIDWLY
jgi:hypothetical protein